MKIILSAMIFMFSIGVSASQDLMHCIVPVENSKITLTITKEDDQSIDFLLISLMEGKTETLFYSQDDKGGTDDQIKDGLLNLVLLTDETRVENGVVYNAGFFNAGAVDEGSTEYDGLMMAKGNIYPFVCSLVVKK